MSSSLTCSVSPTTVFVSSESGRSQADLTLTVQNKTVDDITFGAHDYLLFTIPIQNGLPQSADVALMGEDLRHLPQAFAHARRARRIMLQNVGLSLALITVLMPLALFGVLGLAAVVLVHELAEVVVIANGVRAGKTRRLDAPIPVAVPA